MKALLCLLAFCVPALAQVRMLGTNAVDFTPVQRALAQPDAPGTEWCWKYVAQGVVENSQGGSVTLVQTQVKYEYDGSGLGSRATVRFGNTSDLLGMAAASQMGQGGPISAGHYMVLSPNLRQYYRPVKIETRTQVRNVDTPVTVGQNARLVGWPVGNSTYDCGTAIIGNPADRAANVLTLGPNGLERAGVLSTTGAQQMEKRLFDLQLADAEKGSGSAQFEVGRRYLNGLGTEANPQQAGQWLRMARTNGYEQAAGRLLEKLPPP